MRDRFEEPFEFRVRTKGVSKPSRRPKDSLRVGAFVLALGVSTLCAVFWPSTSKKARNDANVQELASTSRSLNGKNASATNVAPRGSFEDMILNDRRAEFDEISALELADTSLVEEEGIELTEADVRADSKNPVASTVYEERPGENQIASSSFETQVKPTVDDEFDDKFEEEFKKDESEPIKSAPEASEVKNATDKSAKSNESIKSSNAANVPGYFARAVNLPGRRNSVSLRNFARAANLIDPNDAYSPRSLTRAAQVDALDAESR